ncbi:MAG TPA: very short patch repair endonuclease [Verrucomicrobiales bacterium]|nr:very short patch repair endonuclease [Verrucomicrobiales bacterium]
MKPSRPPLTRPPVSRDRLTKEQRSWNMSRIRSKHTKPEVAVRRMLHGMGVRFRLHRAGLPGKPDIVLGPRKLVIFVHGCFWHRHPGCREATMPTGNRDFWQAKLEGNAARDLRHRAELRKLGWRVAVVWECEVRFPQKLERRLERLLKQGLK